MHFVSSYPLVVILRRDFILLPSAVIKALSFCDKVVEVPLASSVVELDAILDDRIIAVPGHHTSAVASTFRQFTIL